MDLHSGNSVDFPQVVLPLVSFSSQPTKLISQNNSTKIKLISAPLEKQQYKHEKVYLSTESCSTFSLPKFETRPQPPNNGLILLLSSSCSPSPYHIYFSQNSPQGKIIISPFKSARATGTSVHRKLAPARYFQPFEPTMATLENLRSSDVPEAWLFASYSHFFSKIG